MFWRDLLLPSGSIYVWVHVEEMLKIPDIWEEPAASFCRFEV
jgi:hypothetical protein